jgi:hypothetical protein
LLPSFDFIESGTITGSPVVLYSIPSRRTIALDFSSAFIRTGQFRLSFDLAESGAIVRSPPAFGSLARAHTIALFLMPAITSPSLPFIKSRSIRATSEWQKSRLPGPIPIDSTNFISIGPATELPTPTTVIPAASPSNFSRLHSSTPVHSRSFVRSASARADPLTGPIPDPTATELSAAQRQSAVVLGASLAAAVILAAAIVALIVILRRRRSEEIDPHSGETEVVTSLSASIFPEEIGGDHDFENPISAFLTVFEDAFFEGS